MSVLRFDESTSDWVIFAPSRAMRPHAAASPTSPVSDQLAVAERCPFCPGNEAFTPPEIFSVRSSHDSSWAVRVVSNKFPALRIEEEPHRTGTRFVSMGGCGAHEVVVESPSHTAFLGQQPREHVEAVLRTLHFRSRDLLRDRRFQTVIVFKNHGVAAGTSLSHPHWQVIATPVVPRMLRLKHNVATEYFDRTGECLYCVMRENEIAAGERILAQNEEFLAFLPYASHQPFETWIMPKRRQASFESLESSQIAPLAAILKLVLLKLYTALDNPGFNLTIDTVPRGDDDQEFFLWHIRIVPRLTTPAGFELGSGMSINTIMPEDAVTFLTEVATA